LRRSDALGFARSRNDIRALNERGRARGRRAHAIARAIDLDDHLDPVGRGAGANRRVDRFAPDAHEIGRRRVDDRPFDHIAYERQRHAER